jgi:hypothetical protein
MVWCLDSAEDIMPRTTKAPTLISVADKTAKRRTTQRQKPQVAAASTATVATTNNIPSISDISQSDQQLHVRPVDSELGTSASATTKQDAVIALLRQPVGATVDEIAMATQWQRHSVRGFISGTVKKKMGLEVVSAIEDRGRVYRLVDTGKPTEGPEIGHA